MCKERERESRLARRATAFVIAARFNVHPKRLFYLCDWCLCVCVCTSQRDRSEHRENEKFMCANGEQWQSSTVHKCLLSTIFPTWFSFSYFFCVSPLLSHFGWPPSPSPEMHYSDVSHMRNWENWAPSKISTFAISRVLNLAMEKRRDNETRQFFSPLAFDF